jgi:hypothetical protein
VNTRNVNLQIFERHVANHPENDKCTYCDFSNYSKNILEKHISNHQHCTECEYVCITPSALKTHMVTHVGSKEYECFECEKFFAQKCSLKTHLKKIHQIE